MPFPMKIQPIDSQSLEEEPIRFEPIKPVVKSRLKRLFDLQFLRNSATEKAAVDESPQPLNKEATEFEPSSACLAKMVQNFIEENTKEKESGAVRCGRNRCNCFNVNCNDSSEDELDFGFGFGDSSLSSSGEACELLKSLVLCSSVCERNLLADTAKIVEKNKIAKRKDDHCMKIVTDELLALGYDASICKSCWEKSSSFPAGEYEYVDVILEGERLIIDIDFRSEFEIARSTKSYKSILQSLPSIFVGKGDRLAKIIAIVSEAVKQSLKKKGMYIPPWRKAEYVKAKWLSPHTRASSSLTSIESILEPEKNPQPLAFVGAGFGEEKLSQEEKNSVEDTGLNESVFDMSETSEDDEKTALVAKDWMPQPPGVILKPKSLQIGVKRMTGLASVIEDQP
ncbi:DUF506 domain-containing protein [Cephalotus follicularis]|uniref:DUF506 domain-containing protein n=1 Tax=Cephalotus follicularis TaxID=3775 RepID=A0A1Q3CFM9_CEPFO|nr:DUF506 domain-containing protein [Cephalotus follicularis]